MNNIEMGKLIITMLDNLEVATKFKAEPNWKAVILPSLKTNDLSIVPIKEWGKPFCGSPFLKTAAYNIFYSYTALAGTVKPKLSVEEQSFLDRLNDNIQVSSMLKTILPELLPIHPDTGEFIKFSMLYDCYGASVSDQEALNLVKKNLVMQTDIQNKVTSTVTEKFDLSKFDLKKFSTKDIAPDFKFSVKKKPSADSSLELSDFYKKVGIDPKKLN